MRRNVYDRRRVSLEQILSEDHIPLFLGRPEREFVINHNDVLDLKIALNTSNSMEELVGKL